MSTNVESLVLSVYRDLTANDLQSLINNTTVNGCKFIGIKNYKSLNSNETECANYTINVGASYDRMLIKDEDKLKNVNINLIGFDFIQNWNYSGINYSKFNTLENYQNEIKNSLSIALNEMLQSFNKSDNDPKRETNDIWLNKLICFNTTTQRLSICGVIIPNGKKVLEIGERKLVAKAPKTVAKEIIKKFAGIHTDNIRRFVLENMNAIKINGNEITIE